MKLVKNKNMLLLFVLFAMIILMSIGYASINSVTGDIEGTALADAQEGVFITNIEYVSDVNASASNSRVNKFLGTVMDSTMKLSDTDVNSSITYKVTVYNKGTEEAIFQKITYANDFYDNNDIIFDITGFTTGEKIGSGESRDIIIKFKYKGTTVPDNNVLNSYLNFVIKAPNRMMANSTHKNGVYKYLTGDVDNTKIVTISFKQGKKSDLTVEPKSEFDASEKQDGSIMGYYTDDNNDGMYDFTFMSEETIYANKDSSYLFHNFTKLTSLDVSNFNTSKVRNMSYMFYSCRGLTSLDVSNFNTSKVTNMNDMFASCSGLTSLDVSNFNTSQVTNMSGMFMSCSGLTSLDVSNFNTSKVTNMSYIFSYCSGLTSLYVSEYNSATQKGWTTENVTSSSDMFRYCNKLVGGNGTKYNSNYTDATYARIDTASTPGYLTKKN